MKPRYWFVLGLLVLAAAAFVLRNRGTQPEAEPAAEATKAPVTRAAPALVTPVGEVPRPAPSAATAPSGGKLADETKATMLDCVQNVESLRGVRQPGDFSTLTEYAARAPLPPSDSRYPTHSLNLHNIHVKTSDGKQLRLQILPQVAPESPGYKEGERARVRLFGVDAENLPVPMDLPEDWKNLDAQQIEQKFRAGGEVTLDELNENVHWSEDTMARMQTRNGNVDQLDVFFRGHELSCGHATPGGSGAVECKCL